MLAHSVLAPGLVVNEADDHDEAKKHMYPRQDTKVTVIPRKDDKHGVGYDPGASLNAMVNQRDEQASVGPNISGTHFPPSFTANQIKHVLLAGFGLGALNEADEDDLDVYDGGTNRGSNRRIAYDDDEEEHERISIGKRRQTSQQVWC